MYKFCRSWLQQYLTHLVRVSHFAVNDEESLSRDDPSRRQGARDWAVGLRLGVVLEVVSVFLNVLFAIKTALLGYGRTECCAVLKKAAYCGLVKCCWQWNVYTTELYERVLVVSFMKFSSCLTFFSSPLRFSQSGCAVVSYLTKNTRLILFGVVFSRSSSAASIQSGIDAFRCQCRGHCILAFLVCHNYALWTQPDPRLRQTKSCQSAIQSVTGHQNTCLKMWWYHLFFITTLSLVRYHRIINPKKSIAGYILSVIKVNIAHVCCTAHAICWLLLYSAILRCRLADSLLIMTYIFDVFTYTADLFFLYWLTFGIFLIDLIDLFSFFLEKVRKVVWMH